MNFIKLAIALVISLGYSIVLLITFNSKSIIYWCNYD